MRGLAWLLLVGALAQGAFADAIPPRVRHKEEVLRKQAEERKRAGEKPPFAWSAPEGFTVTELLEGEGPDFAATSITPPATMAAFVERGAIVIDDTYVADQAKQASDKFIAAHPKGSARIVKKERIKLDAGEAARVVLDTRADKKARPTREAHYWVGTPQHHAHVVYAAPVAQFARLEKKFDASLRRTKGLEIGAPTAPKPEQPRPDVKGP